MDNPTFVDEEDIPMVHQDDDYDNYNTLDTSRVETSFREPDDLEAISTLRLRQKVKRNKITALYRHLNVTGNLDLIDLDRFRLTMDSKKGVTVFEFYNGDWWVPLTKQTDEFFAPKTLRGKLDGLNIMKKILGLDETPPALDKSAKAGTNLILELPTDLEMESIPLKDLSSLDDGIHIKTRETSQNTDLDMREFLGIDKALKSIQGELLNNTSKLTEIDKWIRKNTKKLGEVENDPTYTDEQRQLYRDRPNDLNTEKQARLEIVSQNRKDLQTQVARIKQTIEKVLDKDTLLTEKICTLFKEQGITIFSILTAFLMTISTIVLHIEGVFGGSRGAGGYPSKDKRTLKKWLDRLADVLKSLAGKAAEELPAIIGSVVAATLSYLGKAVGFGAQHILMVIVFIAGLIAVWLMQRVQRR